MSSHTLQCMESLIHAGIKATPMSVKGIQQALSGLLTCFRSVQQVLKLSSQPIRVIEDGAFLGLHRLKKLHLIKCGLTEMPPLTPVKKHWKHFGCMGIS